MKAVVIKNLELPQTEGSAIDIRINADGSALLHCCMGHCVVYRAEEIDLPDEEEK